MNNPITKLCGTSSLVRPQFSPGLLLEDDDLNTGVNYTRNLAKLLFRSLFGCGVICGLKVSGKPVRGNLEITVAKGLALDCMGNPIELQTDSLIEYASDCGELKLPVWVVICYKENCCRPREAACSQDDSSPRPTRVQSGFEVRLYGALPDCACHCLTGDDVPVRVPVNECCEDAQEPTQATATVAEPITGRESDICPCYRSHFLGECECGCNCCCVIVGKITGIPVERDNERIPMVDRRAVVDDSMVRRIRPMLNGYEMCHDHQRAREPKGGIPGKKGPRAKEAFEV